LLYWYKSTNTDAAHPHLGCPCGDAARGASWQPPYTRARYEIYSLYWYKSTNTAEQAGSRPTRAPGTNFTRFTGTKVQKLTLRTHI
jgi:hypothetical protein